MIKHYLQITWRSMKRQKTFSLLNITGLAIGMACFIIIMLWVENQLNFDKHNEHYENIYCVGIDVKIGELEGKGPSSSSPMGRALKEDYPEVVNYARTYRGINKLVSYIEGSVFNTEDKVYYADSTIFDVLTIPILKGSETERLTRPLTLFITESTARKYFGSEDPIGKSLDFDGWWVYEVVGVIADPPATSHWDYDFLACMHGVNQARSENWLSDNVITYIRLADGTDWQEFETKLLDFRNRHVEPQVIREIGMNFEEWGRTGNRYEFYLEPLKTLYINPRGDQTEFAQGNITYVIAFVIIGIFILLLACINFMNLTTARAATRAKEIGLRKVIGSDRWQIIRQLLLESLIFSLISMLLAIIIVKLVLPLFSELTGIELLLNFARFEIIPLLLLLTLLVGILAGGYSALVISSFKITTVLKGNILRGNQNSWLRNSLVIIQFAISIFIIICTMIIYFQLKYIGKKELGFQKDQVLIIERAYSLGDNLLNFKEETSKFPDINAVSITNSVPGTGSNGSVFQKENTSAEDMAHFREVSGDYDYLDALGIELKEGRYFSPDFQGDSISCLINETAVRNMNLEDPIGKKLFYAGETFYFNVIGVVKDYHLNSLQGEIPNLILRPPYSLYNHYMAVNLRTKNLQQTIGRLRETWENLAPNQPFQYFFLDEYFDNLHKAEKQTGTIALIFSILAIIIASMGLYGLATFTAQQKTKEIGVRKVLGASVTGIAVLLLNQFTRWVLLANIIAWPLAWYIMQKWLQNYAYAIRINIVYFIVTGFITIIIAAVTVAYQSIKAATSNPVEALKYE